MSDQETSEFTVVDRRASENNVSSSEDPVETSEASSAAPENSASAEFDEEQQKASLPDPATLVAMGAMHLSTAELAMTLLSVFDGHAWRSLGLIASHNGEVEKDLPAAQLAIDCLAFMLGKVDSQLQDEDRREIHRRLNDLRVNYLAKLREA